MKLTKKVLSLLLVCVIACSCILGNLIPAFAQKSADVTYKAISSLSEISANEQYVLVCWRYFGGSNSDSTKGYVFHSTNDGNLRVDTADNYATVTGTLTDEALWNIVSVDGGYTLQNVGTGKYLGTSIPASADVASTLSIVSGTSNGYTNYCIGTSSTCIRFSGSSNSFSFYSSAPANQVTGTNACNITIYKVVEGGVVEPEPTEPEVTEPIEPANDGVQIVTFSDYQGDPAISNLTTIASLLKKNGYAPERALLLGDYVDGGVYYDGSDTSQSDMTYKMNTLKSTLGSNWSDIEYLAIQGNHDYSGWINGEVLNYTGAYEFDDYIIYLINEDDFPWWQAGYMDYSDTDVCKAAVEKTSAELETYLNGLIAKKCIKPVIIATHVPLHWSNRTTTQIAWWSDNIYADTLFEVVNGAAENLDILFLFGHNHSEAFGNYPEGGTVNYFAVGDTIRIPDGTVAQNNNYTIKTLNFTYMNGGYIGKTNASFNPSIPTASVISITDDQILIDRYTTTGLYSQETIDRYQFGKATLSMYSKDGVSGERKEGRSETFAASFQNAENATFAWTTDSDLIRFTTATNRSEATVAYMGGGEATITCTMTFEDITGATKTLSTSYTVTIKALPQPTEGVSYVAIQSVDDLSADKTYVLGCWRYFGGSNSDSTKAYLLQNVNNGNLRADTEDAYETLTVDGEIPAAAQWKIVPTVDGYEIQNVGDGSYLGTSLHDSSEPATYAITSGTCNGYTNYAISYNNKSIRFSGSSNTFSLSSVTPASAVSTTNACNFTIYEVVTVSVEPEPDGLAIVAHPEDYKGALNSNAYFTVEANRSDVTYRWLYSQDGGQLWLGSCLPGNKTNTLKVIFLPFRAGQLYKCVVTDAEGHSVESLPVTLATATEGLAIVTDPSDYAGALNSTATFTVEATGEGLIYQWYYSNNEGKTWAISTMASADTPSVNVQVRAYRLGQQYKCVVTDASGNQVESGVATILG